MVIKYELCTKLTLHMLGPFHTGNPIGPSIAPYGAANVNRHVKNTELCSEFFQIPIQLLENCDYGYPYVCQILTFGMLYDGSEMAKSS